MKAQENGTYIKSTAADIRIVWQGVRRRCVRGWCSS